MDYLSLNKENRKHINGIINNDFKMEWEYPELLSILLGNLPEKRYSKFEDGCIEELSSLETYLSSYNCFYTDKNEFLSKIKKTIDVIQIKEPNWIGLSFHEIKNSVRMHQFCLLHGEGGIGKTYGGL